VQVHEFRVMPEGLTTFDALGKGKSSILHQESEGGYDRKVFPITRFFPRTGVGGGELNSPRVDGALTSGKWLRGND